MIFSVLQIVLSVLLIAAILLQSPGSGLSPVFGAGGEAYRSKRSAQKFLVIATIVLSSLLVVLSVALLILQRQ